MKVRNLEFHNKTSPDIESVENQTLTCSAYRNGKRILGSWSSVDGIRLNYTSYGDGNIFTIKTNVKKTGTYICSIKSEQEEIQTVTRVNIFSCKSQIFLFLFFEPIKKMRTR